MKLKVLLLGSAMPFLAGCQGTLATHPATPDEIAGNYKGVLFYPSVLMEETSQTTVRIESGKITATSTATQGTVGHCTPIETRKLIVAADFSRPRVLNYDHGLLEGYTFNATLADGMLNSVNTTSTPDQGKTFANLAAGVKDLAPSLMGSPGSPPSDLACTDGVVVTARRPYTVAQ